MLKRLKKQVGLVNKKGLFIKLGCDWMGFHEDQAPWPKTLKIEFHLIH